MSDKKTIVLSSEDGKGLDGQVGMHFGRCPAFIVVEVDGTEVLGSKVVDNPSFSNHQPGAVPQFINSLGADVMIAGGMGPMAIDMFGSFGIEVATGAVGNARRVLSAYLQGEVKGIVPCAHDHPDSCGGEGH